MRVKASIKTSDGIIEKDLNIGLHNNMGVGTSKDEQIGAARVRVFDNAFAAEETVIDSLDIDGKLYKLTQIGNFEHPILGSKMTIYHASVSTLISYEGDKGNSEVVDHGDRIVILDSINGLDFSSISGTSDIPVSMTEYPIELLRTSDVYITNGNVSDSIVKLKKPELNTQTSLVVVRNRSDKSAADYVEVMETIFSLGATNYNTMVIIRFGKVSDICEKAIPGQIQHNQTGLVIIPAKEANGDDYLYGFLRV